MGQRWDKEQKRDQGQEVGLRNRTAGEWVTEQGTGDTL